MAAGYEMRVGDAEREAAAAELQEHFTSGRLNQDELNERVASAFAAKTRGDLNALFTDLPSSGYGQANADSPGGDWRTGAGPWAQAGAWGGGTGSDANWGAGWKARGHACGASGGSRIGRMVMTSVMLWVLFIVGILGIFGIGAGRPLGIVLLVAALALLRRLLFIFFGRRRGFRRGPRRRR